MLYAFRILYTFCSNPQSIHVYLRKYKLNNKTFNALDNSQCRSTFDLKIKSK